MAPDSLAGLHLLPHHRAAIERLVTRLEGDPDTLALLLGGSLAHGFAGPGSDVDVLQVVTPERMARQRVEGRLTWADGSLCDWEGGYVDSKYLDLELLGQVADRGSEPARYAFLDSRVLLGRTDVLDDLLLRIARYPIEGRDDRVTRFTAQLLGWRWYHTEGLRRASDYLAPLARQKVVLFACRIVLARNERLFPFHKWLLAETQRTTDRPPDLLGLVDEALRAREHAPVARLVSRVLDWYAIDEATANATWPSLYMEDTELAWLHGRPPIDDL